MPPEHQATLSQVPHQVAPSNLHQLVHVNCFVFHWWLVAATIKKIILVSGIIILVSGKIILVSVKIILLSEKIIQVSEKDILVSEKLSG